MSFKHTYVTSLGEQTDTIYCRLCSGDKSGLCVWCWKIVENLKPLANFMVWVEMEAWTRLLGDDNDRAHNLTDAIAAGKLKLSYP